MDMGIHFLYLKLNLYREMKRKTGSGAGGEIETEEKKLKTTNGVASRPGNGPNDQF